MPAPTGPWGSPAATGGGELRPGQAPTSTRRGAGSGPWATIWAGRSASVLPSTAGVKGRSCWESRNKEQGGESRSPGNQEINKRFLWRGSSLWSQGGNGKDWLWEEWHGFCDILGPPRADTVRVSEQHRWTAERGRQPTASLSPSSLPCGKHHSSTVELQQLHSMLRGPLPASTPQRHPTFAQSGPSAWITFLPPLRVSSALHYPQQNYLLHFFLSLLIFKYCGIIYIIFTILIILSVQFTGIKYIHIVLQPSAPPTSNSFHLVQLKLCPQ